MIDPGRVASWGTSLSGGHVIEAAAHDSEIAAVIAQVPFTDGLRSLLSLGLRLVLRLPAGRDRYCARSSTLPAAKRGAARIFGGDDHGRRRARLSRDRPARLELAQRDRRPGRFARQHLPPRSPRRPDSRTESSAIADDAITPSPLVSARCRRSRTPRPDPHLSRRPLRHLPRCHIRSRGSRPGAVPAPSPLELIANASPEQAGRSPTHPPAACRNQCPGHSSRTAESSPRLTGGGPPKAESAPTRSMSRLTQRSPDGRR